MVVRQPPDPPELPARWSDMPLILAAGSVAFLLTGLGLVIARVVADRALDVWFATALCGAGLGLVGYGVFSWQRMAARRGTRGAQRGLGVDVAGGERRTG